jgi:hypothetical protein
MLKDNDAYDFSEHEFTEMIAAEATRNGLSFEKYFTAPENVDIRRAHQLTKATLIRPVEVQPVVAEAGRTDTESDAKVAYDQLMEQAERLAAAGEYRSVASEFATVFSDQKNAELAARAHRRPNAASGSSGAGSSSLMYPPLSALGLEPADVEQRDRKDPRQHSAPSPAGESSDERQSPWRFVLGMSRSSHAVALPLPFGAAAHPLRASI